MQSSPREADPKRRTRTSLPAPIRRWLKGSSAAVLNLLLPPRCSCCGAEMDEPPGGIVLCAACRDEMPLINWPTCPRCAALVPMASGVQLACSHCREHKLRFDRAIALGSYEGLLRRLLVRMKEDRSELIARCLADLAWCEVGTRLAELGVDVVTAVPMDRGRRWTRGTNGPQTVAWRIAGRLGVPCAEGMLRLRRKVPPQLGLSRAGRFINIAGEMALAPTYSLARAHVLVVDDILTTGATCSEAARALLRAGAAEVSVFVLARTPAEG